MAGNESIHKFLCCLVRDKCPDSTYVILVVECRTADSGDMDLHR